MTFVFVLWLVVTMGIKDRNFALVRVSQLFSLLGTFEIFDFWLMRWHPGEMLQTAASGDFVCVFVCPRGGERLIRFDKERFSTLPMTTWAGSSSLLLSTADRPSLNRISFLFQTHFFFRNLSNIFFQFRERNFLNKKKKKNTKKDYLMRLSRFESKRWIFGGNGSFAW